MNLSKKQKTKKRTIYSLSTYFWLIVAILILLSPFVMVIDGVIRQYKITSDDTKVIKAVVIDELNHANNSSVNKRHYYSYEFEIAGEKYKGNTLSTKYKVGDSVEVKYYIPKPSINTIIKKP